MIGDLLSKRREHREEWRSTAHEGTEMIGDLLPKRREHRDEWRSTAHEGTQR